MPAYLIAHITVHDPAVFAQYRDQVTPIIERHGGRYIARGGATEIVEGSVAPRLVVVEFPDMATARAFYHGAEYAPAMALRKSCSTADIVIGEGLLPSL